MDLERIKDILKNEPAFRMKQSYKAVFSDLADDWASVSVLPLPLREKLSEEAPLSIKAEINEAKDKKSAKAAIDLGDVWVETVLMKHKDGRNTVCVSTQAGCKMACDFCLTGKMGFKRNLDHQEIIIQVLFFARYLKKSGQRVSNVVFMGMGEPLDNYEEVIKAVRSLNDPETFNIGARKISVSTVGLVDGINKLSSEPLQINLAVSLHAPNDKLRNKLMPISRLYPIKGLMKAISNYIKRTKRKVMIEYIMLSGINDSQSAAKELAELLKKELGELFTVNLIAYNQTGKYEASKAKDVKKFKDILESSGIEVVQRYKFGRDIKAACGQLAGEIK
ncbi:23S rRNA (adenine(2503)-C(2))-methyltransferase RlmN [Candidatus Falkowbacteria bacterium]|nr:23S rRNA (adenine(2503)-C(2))-methyltransferase RlmN [Candidatus Falkowbacteria bacterium]